jgi:transcriptional regulator with XRE-family HTH domain
VEHAVWKRTRLHQKRKELGLTMHQVQTQIGVVPGRLSMYERALVEPKVTMALRLAKFYKTTVEDLFGKRRLVVEGEQMALVEVRNRVRDVTNKLQAILSHVEDDNKVKAMIAIADTMEELSKITTLVANGFLEDSPHEALELQAEGKQSIPEAGHGG